MKKLYLIGSIAFVVLMVGALNVTLVGKSDKNMDFKRSNIEAFGQNENGNGKGTLYDIYNSNGVHVGMCCCPGSNSCVSASCPSSACE